MTLIACPTCVSLVLLYLPFAALAAAGWVRESRRVKPTSETNDGE